MQGPERYCTATLSWHNYSQQPGTPAERVIEREREGEGERERKREPFIAQERSSGSLYTNEMIEGEMRDR